MPARRSGVLVQEVPEALHFNRTAWIASCDGGSHLLNVGGSLDRHSLRFGRPTTVIKLSIHPPSSL